MKILAFDGTAKVASVAVCDGERVLAAYSIDNGLTQSELLLPMAEDALKSLKLGFSDIDAYATSVGPGSFTGVRIGVSLVKGLAFGRDIPCIEVSTLEALAENLSGLEGVIVPCMDARRAQVYNALFISSDEGLERITEDRAISLDALVKELKGYEGKKIYLVGDGYGVARAALIKAGLTIEHTPEILINENAASVARVAQRKYERGEYTTDNALSPIYLRLPQAERERLERESKKND
ncbi:MAG: tRNA (adenosine(37)-N6)-threonylcarbamoyltransferase complex dimerization subunit type 1 TsaB [Clostridia bacterium]|nr:tRNA (adenosine(37)-N6)-threonylcarbamoyltransferase complex dimerization subunit type 1 TsaB [Clostridia bacterium]